MAIKKPTKPAQDTPEAEITLFRDHPSNPILITDKDILDNPPRIQIRTPRPLVIRGLSSNRVDLGAVLLMPENTTGEVVAVQPDAHMAGYSVTSGLIAPGEEVKVFIRNHSQRTVNFEEGAIIGHLVFQRHRAHTLAVDVALAPIPEKQVVSRRGMVSEDELPEAD